MSPTRCLTFSRPFFIAKPPWHVSREGACDVIKTPTYEDVVVDGHAGRQHEHADADACNMQHEHVHERVKRMKVDQASNSGKQTGRTLEHCRGYTTQ